MKRVAAAVFSGWLLSALAQPTTAATIQAEKNEVDGNSVTFI
jgi:hypothetical protein